LQFAYSDLRSVCTDGSVDPLLNDLFVSFRCENPISFSYRLDALTLGMKALIVAKETYLRINKDGVACIQHQVETAKGPETYIDFLMIPIDAI
jgi:hypothetical protein